MPLKAKRWVVGWIVLECILCVHARAQTSITLQVDAREAQRRVLHAHLTIPAQPGPMTLFYPKWITWAPIGPINNLVGLTISARGNKIPWQRDGEDLYAFHLNVPAGAAAVDVSLDYVTPIDVVNQVFDPTTTDQLLVLNWNLVTLYPAGKASTDYTIKTTLLLPDNWKFGTALPVARLSNANVEFEPVTLDTLIDSPVIAGAHFRAVSCPASGVPPTEMDIVADHESAFAVSRAIVNACSRLMRETTALFGGYHFRSYHFLITLSDLVTPVGIEHHESSDDRYAERAMIDGRIFADVVGGNLAHELVHSYNGKYRRPFGVAESDYQQTMNTELVWVYEGLTEYLGRVLHARMGLESAEHFREGIASDAAQLDHTAGRMWRPLVDTAISVAKLSEAGSEWTSLRRDGDFYNEGALVWLEADLVIRRQTNGLRSLDDFCSAFFGPPSGPPLVKPYTLEDLVTALNQIAPYDWKGFFQKRVYEIAPHVFPDGFDQSGWKLVYNATPNYWDQGDQESSKTADLSYSIGMQVEKAKSGEEGEIVDVIPGMAAAEAGIAPGMKLVTVNGQPWSPGRLRSALVTPGAHGLELGARNAGFLRTYKLKYDDGLRYPHLERDPAFPDLLGQIIAPRVQGSSE